ncbi:MAG: accessory gene regulator B family protein [Clostridia bacterium]|nr:accessory gene regulator B family protein [Clostridia bacterium]
MRLDFTGWCYRMAFSLADKLGMNQDQADIMRFGLETLAGMACKAIILLTLAWALGILGAVLAVLITAGALRLVAGGVHCTSYERCLTFGLVTFLGLGEIAQLVSRYLGGVGQTGGGLWILYLGTFLLALAVCVAYAPQDSPARPLAIEEKHGFRWLAVGMVVLWGLGVAWRSGKPVEIWVASSLGLMMEAFSLTPWGTRVVKLIDSWLARILPGGGEADEEVGPGPASPCGLYADGGRVPRGKVS